MKVISPGSEGKKKKTILLRWRELSADVMLMKAKDQTGLILASPGVR